VQVRVEFGHEQGERHDVGIEFGRDACGPDIQRVAAQHLDPRPERRATLHLVTPAPEHARGVGARDRFRLLGESGLADPRLARKQNELAASVPRRSPCVADLAQLLVATDEHRAECRWNTHRCGIHLLRLSGNGNRPETTSTQGRQLGRRA